MKLDLEVLTEIYLNQSDFIFVHLNRLDQEKRFPFHSSVIQSDEIF